MGARARQGPHQVAQKSIKTGLSDLSTSESKFASFTSTIALFAIDPPEIQFSIPVLSSPARVEPLRHCRRTDILTLSLDAAEGQKSQEGAWSLIVRGSALEKICSPLRCSIAATSRAKRSES